LKGATGTQGIQGIQGLQGIQGIQGPTGSTGTTGATGTAATISVGTVTTGAPGSSASVSNAGSSGAAVFNFTIPQGEPGTIGSVTNWASGTSYSTGQVVYCAACTTNGSSYISLVDANQNHDPSSTSGFWTLIAQAGATGATGSTGLTGSTGANGAAATISVGTVTTGAAGSSANVSNAGNSSAAVFNFTIPQGEPGTIGAVTNYSTSATYSTGQVVFCSSACSTNGSSYISLTSGNLNHDPPTSAANWTLIAQAGAAGTMGEQGPIGDTGAAGVIQSLAVGTVSNTAAAGAGTLTVSNGTSANPTISINFPSGSNGLTGLFSTALILPSNSGQAWNPVSGFTQGISSEVNPVSQSTMNDAIQLAVPTACTLNTLNIRVSPNLGGFGGNDSLFFYVIVNNVPSSIDCSLTVSSSNIETCSDTTHALALSSGERFAIAFTDSNNSDVNNSPFVTVASSVTCN